MRGYFETRDGIPRKNASASSREINFLGVYDGHNALFEKRNGFVVLHSRFKGAEAVVDRPL
ncbi:protein of unknown function [Candidatus Filomicrobium marinum]|uniref:Uncharacterized protein n=1 Tax=Candidatus Filomicrobium marinum TaxID=1608628 RepID=A0A0D6JD68_9HYPH|nr:protein of unknown function [Candidatus Filomicrobium marinum]CPR17644.1 protein of unknown function [Candidatus Filomicrobium marinum]